MTRFTASVFTALSDQVFCWMKLLNIFECHRARVAISILAFNEDIGWWFVQFVRSFYAFKMTIVSTCFEVGPHYLCVCMCAYMCVHVSSSQSWLLVTAWTRPCSCFLATILQVICHCLLSRLEKKDLAQNHSADFACKAGLEFTIFSFLISIHYIKLALIHFHIHIIYVPYIS